MKRQTSTTNGGSPVGGSFCDLCEKQPAKLYWWEDVNCPEFDGDLDKEWVSLCDKCRKEKKKMKDITRFLFAWFFGLLLGVFILIDQLEWILWENYDNKLINYLEKILIRFFDGIGMYEEE